MRFRLKLDPAVPYLQQRGLTPETIARYGLGMCNRGLLKGYVAIPVYRYPTETPDETPVAYLGRWPGDDHDESAGRPRYKWPAGFPKQEFLFGFNEALESPPAAPILVVSTAFPPQSYDASSAIFFL